MAHKDDLQSADEGAHDPDALRDAARRMRTDEKGDRRQREAGTDEAKETHDPAAIDEAARRMYLRKAAEKDSGPGGS